MAPTVGKALSKGKIPPSPFKARPKPAGMPSSSYPTGGGSKTHRSGLVFNVDRTLRKLKKGNYAKKVYAGAAVYLTGVMEYLMSEILELSGDVAISNKRVRIIPRHIMMAVKQDDELDKFMGNVTIPDSGVVPFLHPVLLPKRRTPRRQQRSVSRETLVSPSRDESRDEQMPDSAAY